MSGGGGSYGCPTGLWGPGIGSGSSLVNDHAAKTIVLAAEKHLQCRKTLTVMIFPNFFDWKHTKKCIANKVWWEEEWITCSL